MRDEIGHLKTKVSKLSVKQRRELIDFIKNSYSVFNEYATVEKCPACGSKHIVKNGTRKGITRHICRNCRKSFTYKSTTILKGIHELNKWNAFVEDFVTLNISTVKRIAERLDISTQTAIDWRHKLLSALVSKENTFTNETVEFDEAFFLISRKGRRNLGIQDKKKYMKWRCKQVGDSDYNTKVFFTYSRTNNYIELTLSHMGRTSAADLERYFLPSKFKSIAAITDRHRSYAKFFKKSRIPHKTFRGSDHVNPNDKTIHNQTINAYTRDFKNFVNKHMKGVSTKYIGFYAKWFEFIVNTSKVIAKVSKRKSFGFNLADNICNNILADSVGLEFYRQSEYSFLNFLKINKRSNWGSCKNHYYA